MYRALNYLGSYCDCKRSNYLSPFVSKAASLVAHPFYDMKATMNLENLKFPWNCSITSATAGESSDNKEFGSGKTPDGSKISDKYSELLDKAISEMSGIELMKGSNNMGKKMNLLVHPMMMKVSLMGQSSERDMMDMGK